jgi:hypothetical protein
VRCMTSPNGVTTRPLGHTAETACSGVKPRAPSQVGSSTSSASRNAAAPVASSTDQAGSRSCRLAIRSALPAPDSRHARVRTAIGSSPHAFGQLPPALANALHRVPKARADPRYFQPVSLSELVATGGSGRSSPGRTGP